MQLKFFLSKIWNQHVMTFFIPKNSILFKIRCQNIREKITEIKLNMKP